MQFFPTARVRVRVPKARFYTSFTTSLRKRVLRTVLSHTLFQHKNSGVSSF